MDEGIQTPAVADSTDSGRSPEDELQSLREASGAMSSACQALASLDAWMDQWVSAHQARDCPSLSPAKARESMEEGLELARALVKQTDEIDRLSRSGDRDASSQGLSTHAPGGETVEGYEPRVIVEALLNDVQSYDLCSADREWLCRRLRDLLSGCP